MPAATSRLNQTEIIRSFTLTALIIIMDMSGFAGLAAEERLEEEPTEFNTLSNLNLPGFQVGLANMSQSLAISNSGSTACAVLDDGTLWCWGTDSEYSMGNGNSIGASPTPMSILGPFGSGALTQANQATDLVVSVTLGHAHFCALIDTGNPSPGSSEVWCWGNRWASANYHSYSHTAPEEVNSLDGDVVLVESGNYHTCAILYNGSVQCWGDNANGQLGLQYKCVTGAEGMCGTSGNYWGASSGWHTFIAIPQYFTLPAGKTAVGLNLWGSNTCVILNDASYICTGSSFGGTGTPEYKNGSFRVAAANDWSAISTSGYLLALSEGTGSEKMSRKDLDVYARNAANTSYQSDVSIDDDILSFTGSSNDGPNSNQYECIILNNKSLACGDLGYDMTEFTGYLQGAWIETPSGANPSAIISQDGLTCMVLNNGSIQCWGDNQGGYIGDGSSCLYGLSDPTGCTSNNFVTSPRYVSLPAGRYVALGEMDTDGDGIGNIMDRCPNTSTSWTSTSSNDNDRDGCRDSDEDSDDDNDGYPDTVDEYPLNPTLHHNLTMADGWVVSSRYENVSVSGPCYPADGNTISESESTTLRSTDCYYGLAISVDNQLVYHDGSPSPSVGWDASDGVTALDSKNGGCVILESGALHCWGSNDYAQVGAGNTNGDYGNPSESHNVSFPVNYAVKQIDKQDYGTSVVLENGEAYYWGRNDGTYNENAVGFTCNGLANNCDGNGRLLSPTKIQINESVSSLYSQSNTMYQSKCAVLENGNAVCWGENDDGQLGTGTTSYESTPTPLWLPSDISSNSIVTMAMISDNYWGLGGTSCALWENGTIYCWGNNQNGQTGDGSTCPQDNYQNNCNGAGRKPIIYDPVILPSDTFAIALWNYDTYGFCALISNGGIWCWGPSFSSTGIGEYLAIGGDPFIQPGNRDWDSDGIFNTQDNCAAGSEGWTSTPSIDLDADGCIDATEDDDDDGDSYSDTTETDCGTDPLNSTDVPQDPDNDGLCNAFDDDDDNDGVLDINDDFPNDQYGFIQLSLGDGFQDGQPLDNATLTSSGRTHCMILNDNSIRCWGENNRGQLGDGTRGDERHYLTNVSLPAGKIPRSISGNSADMNSGENGYFCAIMDDGSLYCWGYNGDGQMGSGNSCTGSSYINDCNGNSGISSPTQVTLPTGRIATAISTGGNFMCTILDDGSVWCWGDNSYGQLGVGNSSNSGNWRYTPNPVMMPTGSSAVAIASGGRHSCMIIQDGRAFCWGYNYYGQIGDGTSDTFNAIRNLPTQVYSASDYISISAGYEFTCAITTLYSLECWGNNNDRQIGYSTSNPDWKYVTPKTVTLPSNLEVRSISTGASSACAILETMETYCWGDDNNGRINTAYNCAGDYTNGCSGSSRMTPAPYLLPTNRGAVAMTLAGWQSMCLLIDNGGLYCSGYDWYVDGETSVGYFVMPVGISLQTNDRDLDHDGIFNNEDDCMEGESGWISNSTTDFDGDGCRDATEDLDDDNDFLNDTDEATLGTNSTNPDTDGDGYLDGLDAFPLNSTEWSDADGDGIGDNADTDDDNDLWSDTDEVACNTDPLNGTDTPVDTDGDSQCNYLDSDDDGDGVSDDMDTFPLDPAATTDTDGDGMPDSLNGNSTTNLTEDDDDDNDLWSDIDETACGTNPLSNASVPQDSDNDMVCDPLDVFPNDSTEWSDSDSDGVGDNSDVFPNDSNETSDNDGDGLGDNADTDDDNDNWSDSDEVACLTNPLDNSSIPGDIDADGICDALELDLDNDGWTNANESYCGTDWTDVHSVPLDTDGDMICDIMDYDDDGDLVLDVDDAFPLDGTEWLDSDGDGIGNNADPDDDNDGCMDLTDDLPLDPTECYDTDNDGIGNNADDDDDGDNLSDSEDPFPQDGSATVDTDGDGYPDFLNGNSTTGLIPDWDDDNDGWNDTDDAFPLDATEWLDTDMDGQGNNADLNDDGDPCLDVDDAFPLDASECYDTDGDGIGNNADPDDDNDGWLDTVESICGTSDPLNASSVPDDFDGDGVCDLLDYDDDNDSYIDTGDAFPFDPCAAVDSDGDGDPDWIFYNCNTTLTEDLDDDNDGIDDIEDVFPLDPTEWQDTDGDGMGDNSDPDVDGDQVPNEYDMFPYNSTEWADNDEDGIGDNADLDDDNDGVLDDNDDFPLDAAASVDTDGDGMPDTLVGNVTTSLVEDDDDDGDGVLDIYDWAPLDPSEWVDTDGDGIGDNADADDDGDGWSDSDEYICGSNHLDASSVPPDGDGDGICDSQDNSDTSTLSGRIQYYMNSPVTVWMAVVGVLCALVIGATGSSLRSAKERRMLVQQTIDYSDSVSGHEEFGTIAVGQVDMPIPKLTSSQVGRQDLVQKYLNQGYSSEVANILADDELNN